MKLFEHTWGGSTGAHMNISRSTVPNVPTPVNMYTQQNPQFAADSVSKFCMNIPRS